MTGDDVRSWDDLSDEAKARIEAADRADAVPLAELVAQFDETTDGDSIGVNDHE